MCVGWACGQAHVAAVALGVPGVSAAVLAPTPSHTYVVDDRSNSEELCLSGCAHCCDRSLVVRCE